MTNCGLVYVCRFWLVYFLTRGIPFYVPNQPNLCQDGSTYLADGIAMVLMYFFIILKMGAPGQIFQESIYPVGKFQIH